MRKSCRLFGIDELVPAAKHIVFEIQHFRCYAALRKNSELAALCPAAAQAVGYALLIHLRILIEFFFCEPKKDDCHLVHFRVIPGFMEAFPPGIHGRTPRTDEVLKYLSKLLAHFSATRWEGSRPAWDWYEEYSSTIEVLAARFELALPDELKSAYDIGYRKWIHHSPTVRVPLANTRLE